MAEITIAIICPSRSAYKNCKKIMQLESDKYTEDRKISFRKDDNMEIYAIFAGPGKIKTATATQFLIDNFDLNYVIDTGAAGALNEKIPPFSVLTGVRSYEYDVLSGEEFSSISSDLITETVITEEDSLAVMEDFINEISGSIKIMTGNIAAGEKNVNNAVFRDLLNMRLNADICNWESSAVLKTAELNGINSLSFRVITDLADKNMEDDLEKNWNQALDILYNVLNDFIYQGWLKKINNIKKGC